ncbi:hypothetical protein HID58_087585, partial [Brassica napus]
NGVFKISIGDSRRLRHYLRDSLADCSCAITFACSCTHQRWNIDRSGGSICSNDGGFGVDLFHPL